MTTSNDPFPWVVQPQHDPYTQPWPPSPYPWQPFTTGTISVDCEPPLTLRDRLAHNILITLVRTRKPQWFVDWKALVKESFESADAFLEFRRGPSHLVVKSKENTDA